MAAEPADAPAVEGVRGAYGVDAPGVTCCFTKAPYIRPSGTKTCQVCGRLWPSPPTPRADRP